MTTETPPKRPRGYQKHEVYLMKATVKRLGSRAVDRRTKFGRALAQWGAELAEDLGGANTLSVAQKSLIEIALRTRLMLDSTDAWILAQPRLVDVRRRALLPVVRERQSLAASLLATLTALGLERRARPVESLAQIMAHHAEQQPDPVSDPVKVER
ncbi:MAG: hypothetical protein ABI565_07800 [Vicinamibacteria bacterium]